MFPAGSGVVALVLSALIHWRAPRSLAPLLVLLCFMAPQAIALPAVLGTISGFADFPGSPFESSIDPVARTVSGFDGTIGFCSITVGGITQAPRSLDVDFVYAHWEIYDG